MANNKTLRLSGTKSITKNLNKAIAKIEGDLEKGLNVGGAFLLQKAVELTPVDLGFLVATSGFLVRKRSNKIELIVFYTANYAPFVHEMPNSTNFQKTGAENKFLSKAVENNQKQFLKRVKKFAKR